MDQDTILDDDYEGSPKGNIEYAGFWIRVGATIIDTLIFLPLLVLEFYNKLNMHSMSLMMLVTLAMLIYKPWLEYARGATIGKSAFGIKVVDLDYQLITLNQAILRYAPWLISAFIGFMMNIAYYTGEDYADNFLEISVKLQGTFWSNMNGLYSIVFFVIIIFVAFDKYKQGLHDKIAETYCIISK